MKTFRYTDLAPGCEGMRRTWIRGWVKTGTGSSDTHRTSCSLGTRGSLAGVKKAQREDDHTPPNVVVQN